MLYNIFTVLYAIGALTGGYFYITRIFLKSIEEIRSWKRH